jgi:poly-D-alanine transfer protein DltD
MAIFGWILIALIIFFLALWLPKNLATYLAKSWFENNYPDWANLLPSYNRMFWNPRRWTVMSWLSWLQKKLTKQLAEVEKQINLAEVISKDPEFASRLVSSGVYDQIQQWIKSPAGQEFKKVVDEINKKGKND